MNEKLPPGINMVVIYPNIIARNALIRVIQETSGIKPVAKKDTVSARRAHYADARTRAIINVASNAMYEQLGFHRVCHCDRG